MPRQGNAYEQSLRSSMAAGERRRGCLLLQFLLLLQAVRLPAAQGESACVLLSLNM
jgi:hypothetical protein